ncbi:hypothetical protein [Aurantiacibacter spongiae]|uniref:Amidase n=1 Tax=Aurantiacibacter spongiae TaxID=2488860 RepID=A0A3N5DKN5_9SPHN|nr:hypothetical protein [Aurantiacibacter spongiae]RPF71345.1 hypothetical protein EG799_06765 [Aurantiacibacter spongiae]
MATAKRAGSRRGGAWFKALLLVSAVLAGTFWYYRAPIMGLSAAGTAYGAKNACSCRFIAGRSLSSCKDDFIDGMGAIWLSQDEEAKSVTAYVPLVASNTATWREGYGCTLARWEG